MSVSTGKSHIKTYLLLRGGGRGGKKTDQAEKVGLEPEQSAMAGVHTAAKHSNTVLGGLFYHLSLVTLPRDT